MERHGRKPMKPANRFNLQVTWREVRRITGHERASALVEFGLGWIFILAPIVIGILYGGIAFYDYEVLSNAVANGAKTLAESRWAGAGSSTNENACQLAQAEVQATAYGLKKTSLPICAGTCSPGIEFPTFSNPAGGTAKSTCDAMQTGEIGTITATYPCVLYFPKLGINLCNGGSQMITAQTSIRIE